MATDSRRLPHVDVTAPFNKWWLVLGSFSALIFGVNTVNILFNVIGPAWMSEFHWSRLQISAGLTIFTVFDGFSILAAGFLVGIYGIRLVSIPIALLFGAAIAAMGLCGTSLAGFYGLCALAGCGAGSVGPTVHCVVAQAWFEDRRGLALGIVNVGLGLCGTIMPFLINGLQAHFGWRSAVECLGVLCAIIPTVVFALVLRMPPSWEVARLQRRAGQSPMHEEKDFSLIRSSRFWLICLAIFLISVASYGFLSQIVAITTDHGFAKSLALATLSTASISSILARAVIGYLLDKFFAPAVAAIIFILCALGVGLIVATHSTTGLYCGAVLLGLGLGAEGDVAAYIVSRYMPREVYSRALGVAIFLFAQGGAAGVLLLGYARSATGSYAGAGLIIIILICFSAVSLLALGGYRYDVRGARIAGREP